MRAATDTEIEITSKERGAKFHRQMVVKKQRDGKSGIKIPFGLNVMEIGKDEDNDPITTCHVVLESDNEFESVIPSAIDMLTEGQRALYLAVKVSNHLHTPTETQAYGWYKVFIESPSKNEKDAYEMAKNGHAPLPCTQRSFDGKRSTVAKQRDRLIELHLIKKGPNNQLLIA